MELAAFLAISHFNDGAKALIFILEELGIDPGCHCIAACHKVDYNRVHHSIRKSSEQAKKAENTLEIGRKDIRKLLKQERDHLLRLVPSKVLSVTKH